MNKSYYVCVICNAGLGKEHLFRNIVIAVGGFPLEAVLDCEIWYLSATIPGTIDDEKLEAAFEHVGLNVFQIQECSTNLH